VVFRVVKTCLAAHEIYAWRLFHLVKITVLDFHNSNSAMAQSDALPDSNTDQTFHYFVYIESRKYFISTL